MAVPRNRMSRSRTQRRRSHSAKKAKTIIACPKCGQASIPHRICPNCGHYHKYA